MKRRIMTIAAAGLSMVLALTVAESASATTLGPSYAWKYGSATYASCVNHTSAGTTGNNFIANSNGGGVCSVSYLEVIYVNNSGKEVAIYKTKYWGQGGDLCGASCAQIVLPRSSYRRIVEVLASSQYGGNGHTTGGVNLYF